MKSEGSAWAFLRPVLLVVAATAAWIALSAAGASADSSPSRDSLAGAVDSATASLTHQAKDELDPMLAGLDGGPAKAPASTVASLIPVPRIPAPSLRPAAEEVSGLADNAVQSVPVVNELVPTGAVAAMVDPVVGGVDGIVDGTVGAAVPLADAVLEPLDPVLEPVVSAVTPPVVGPEAGPGAGRPVATAVSAASAEEPAPGLPTVAELPQTTGGVTHPAPSAAKSQASVAERRMQMMRAAVTPVLSEAGPEDAPFHTPSDLPPAVPGAAIGGNSPSGANGPAAPGWISPHYFPAPADGTAAIQGRSLTAPTPASFDPGSSPD
ncbi:hypothetical protein QF031_003900 [Pseudarthrobacter defluvii]|uniref:hypothetical protein n=1 Tax=Pseudarthrobacter defluvii TaxID=410837 RepID=UPI002787EEC6|nr:hypothetical protein [Pseudarthrobacter defluvii]MDQ0771151.1 hypothetical protein [Pseudarthrobacter defluvii]